MTVLSLHSGAKSLKYFANAGVQFGEEGTMAAAVSHVFFTAVFSFRDKLAGNKL